MRLRVVIVAKSMAVRSMLGGYWAGTPEDVFFGAREHVAGKAERGEMRRMRERSERDVRGLRGARGVNGVRRVRGVGMQYSPYLLCSLQV